MLDKLQNDLLLKHPLLWNIKIIPLLAVTLTLHIIFFGIGYVSGAINFKETGFEYFSYSDNSGVVVTFSILISLLVLIVWLVYYFRNNAYKSYYPQHNTSLYKEWLLILVISILNCSYTASYFFAQDLRARSYFPEEEFSRRIDVLSMASLFAEGGYNSTTVTEEHNGQIVHIEKETIFFRGREYSAKSLINKVTNNFSYQGRIKDSLNELRVKTWLVENRKDSVLWLMTEFESIAKSHDLKGNITANQWLNLVYDYPDYNEYAIVGKIDKYPHNSYGEYTDYEYDETAVLPDDVSQLNSLSTTIKMVNGEEYVFNKYHVPLLQLNNAYDEISESWVSPKIDSGLGLFYLLLSFCLSMGIFSFRVTSGRGWLIALVIMGVTAMITGLFSIMSGGEGFTVIWLLILAGLLIYFLSVYTQKASKGISGILLNTILWLSIWFIPMVLSVLHMVTHPDYGRDEKPSPFYTWLDHNSMLIMFCNFAFIIAYMYFLSAVIKKWKGIAEA